MLKDKHVYIFIADILPQSISTVPGNFHNLSHQEISKHKVRTAW